MNLRLISCATGILALFPFAVCAAEGVSSTNSTPAPATVDVAKAINDWTRIYVGAFPCVSRDGTQFSFEWNDRIWIAPTAGGVAHPIAAQDGTRDSRPILSPDASRVMFISNRLMGENVFEYSLTDGKLRQVTVNSLPPSPQAYAPDGKSFLATVKRDHSDSLHALRIALVSPDGVEKILFDAKGGEPALSPDGTKLLFVRGGDSLYRKRATTFSSYAAEIWLYDLKTRAFTLVVQNKTDSRTPVWAADGQGFYYVSGDGGSKNLHYRSLMAIDAPNGATKATDFAITSFQGDNIIQPSISGDGRTLVFRQGFDFWRLDLTQAHPRPQLIYLHPDTSWSPALTTTRNRWYTSIGGPDGKGTFSFLPSESNNEVAFIAGGDLWIMCMPKREPVLVHGGADALERDCVFSKDCNKLFFLSDHGDGTDLWVATRADPKKPWCENTAFKKTRLVADGKTRRRLSLSPDGKRLMWQDGFFRLHFSNLEGLDTIDGPDMAADDVFAWSADGKWLAASFRDNDSNYDVWIISTTNEHAPVNVSRHYKWDGDPAWSPDGKILAWCGRRPDGDKLFYFYLDGKEGKGAPNEINFEDIDLRVKSINAHASNPVFNINSRDLAFNDGNQTAKISIPDNLKPSRLTQKRGIPQLWGTEKDKGRLLWSVDDKPAHFENVASFNVYPVFDMQDYRELLGRMAWGRIRDRFYDPNFHGADWGAIKGKYVPAFRHALSYSVMQRLVYMMLGELDASHLGFTLNDVATKEWIPDPFGQNWKPITGHLGLRFDPTYAGPGLRVRDVLHDGPADKANRGIRPGDLVTEINGKKTDPKADLAKYLTAHDQLKVTFTFGHPGEPATNVVKVSPINQTRARELVGAQQIRDNRKLVHKLSNGRIGYVYVPAMDNPSFTRFESEVFSEGYGRDALIIDVRDNHGGFTADRMLSILCQPSHSFEIPRNGKPGYLMSYTVHPVWNKPLAVICNAESGSNAEIFTHAIKTIKRGIVVGQATGGAVIATTDRPLLDFGDFRDAEFGWYVNGGIDMESHGAEPDIPVALTPIDEVRGVDPQLETAVKELLKK